MFIKTASKIYFLSWGVYLLTFWSVGKADVFTVINTYNSGEGSLRKAISDANLNTGPDTIVFNISDSDLGYDPEMGVWTIRPENNLPTLSDGETFIDGSSQDESQGNRNPLGPDIVLDGTDTEDYYVIGITIASSENVIRGLVIVGFEDGGIELQSEQCANNNIQGNYIGVDATGRHAQSNGKGIWLLLGANENIIGGSEPHESNIISGNVNSGVIISGSHDNLVIGNIIGLDAEGDSVIANGNKGVVIYDGSQGNRIGGDTEAERNVISGNVQGGISIYGEGTRENVIKGNYIGTDQNGTQSRRNESYGISLSKNTKANTIGGFLPGEGNLVSGNKTYGINVSESDSNIIQGNAIGTDMDLVVDLGNGWSGVEVTGNAQYNQIGPGNTIAYNGGVGVEVYGSETLYNRITQNSVFNNGSKGIQLDNGGNLDLTCPVITGAGPVEGTAAANARVEIFSDSLDEGMKYEFTVLADELGNFTWSGIPQGPKVTATATDEDGNTSEFSEPMSVGGFVVTNTNDSGEGSLRWAIETANNHAGPDTIQFNIPTDDEGFKDKVWTIKPLTNLPAITDDGTVIDGFSQAVNQGDTNSVGPEIMLDGRENIEENGVGFEINSTGNEIKDLIISGFNDWGVVISGSETGDNRVRGNYIGTNPSGNDTLGNGGGLFVRDGSSHNIVGGEGENEGNVISGNHDDGIFISSSDSNVVIGNKIGTDATGTLSLGNGQNGVYIGYYCTGNVIGGSTAGERNIISGNEQDGIYVYGRQIRGNVIQGNFIGIDINGTSALGNKLGINLGWEVSNTLVGGLASGEGNVISGNERHGIRIYRNEADSNQVLGNFIGTGAEGESDIGNGQHGIYLTDGTQKNQIGPQNVIRYNGWDGVAVEDDLTLYNRITQNSISNNQGEGIHLSYGGNGELASPVITGVGSVEGTAPANATIEIFSDSLDEGMTYQATVLANGSGNFTWSGTPQGPMITATATDDLGNTSEFSEPMEFGKLEVINTKDSGYGSLRWALEQANNNNGPDTIRFNIPPDDEGFQDNVWVIKPLTDLPRIMDDSTVVDGFSQTKNQGNTNTEGPEIVLDGQDDSDKYNKGLLIHSADNVVKGLKICRFSRGIFLTTNSAKRNKIMGNYIGSDAGAADSLGNSVGITISDGAKYNLIGGKNETERNIISGNSNSGISLYRAADSNMVCGNWIGLDITGEKRVSNMRGISVSSGCKFNQIGPDNIISGNLSCGIELCNTGTDSNWVQGNWIGLDVTGQDTIGNKTYGIYLTNASHNQIGGLTKKDGNVISGNAKDGLNMAHGLYNIIQNNYLGTDTSGTRDLGNCASGIYFWGSGTRNIFCDNIISGNNSYGILISGSHEGNIFRDNKIGVQVDECSPLPNQFSGIRIKDQATADTIGPGNKIWYNGKYGILLEDSSVTRITITQNSIAQNDSGGIALQDKANENIIAPVIGEQNPLTGTAPPNSKVEIFSDSSNQGRIYEGTVQADGSGEWTFNGSISGPKVTVTATDPKGNTSEFSSPAMVTAVETTERQIPERYFLFQNYPNPFNPETSIRFEVKEVCRVTLKVYDLRGREVCQILDEQYQPGRYEATFNGEGLSSGIYFYQIRMGDFQVVKKMVMMK